MQRDPDGEAASRLQERSDAYLDAVVDCVDTLPDVLSGYGAADGTFDAAVDRLAERESRCDDRLSTLRKRLGRSRSPEFTDVYLLAGDFVAFYAAVDEVANRAERLARELAAIGPALPDDVLDALADLARLAVEATERLADLASRYVAGVATATERASIADAVEEIRDLERRADSVKYDAMARAFEASRPADGLLSRELLRLADDVPNAVEDAADHLVYLHSVTV